MRRIKPETLDEVKLIKVDGPCIKLASKDFGIALTLTRELAEKLYEDLGKWLREK